MAEISKIILPNGMMLDLKDAEARNGGTLDENDLDDYLTTHGYITFSDEDYDALMELIQMISAEGETF